MLFTALSMAEISLRGCWVRTRPCQTETGVSAFVGLGATICGAYDKEGAALAALCLPVDLPLRLWPVSLGPKCRLSPLPQLLHKAPPAYYDVSFERCRQLL